MLYDQYDDFLGMHYAILLQKQKVIKFLRRLLNY